MYTQVELLDAIDELNDGKHTVQNCEKLAAIYTVLDHLYGEKSMIDVGYSNDSKIESEIGSYGNSNFLKLVSGKPSKEVWLLIDDLIEAITVLNPRLADNFLDQISSL